MINDLFESKKEVNYEELSLAIKDWLWSHFKDSNDNLEEFIEDHSFSYNEVCFETEVIVLPSTYFDMRGDGETTLHKKSLVNLNTISEITAYAVETLICEKKCEDEPAYAVYQLDNNELVVLKIESTLKD